MIDNFALALTHALIALAIWRIVWRDDLDGDRAAADKKEAPPGA